MLTFEHILIFTKKILQNSVFQLRRRKDEFEPKVLLLDVSSFCKNWRVGGVVVLEPTTFPEEVHFMDCELVERF